MQQGAELLHREGPAARMDVTLPEVAECVSQPQHDVVCGEEPRGHDAAQGLDGIRMLTRPCPRGPTGDSHVVRALRAAK